MLCISKILRWPPLAPMAAKSPGNIFSPRTALTCALRQPRFFAAARVPLKPALRTQMPPVDPHHDQYIAWFTRALQSALDGLEPHEKHRLRFYYAEEKTLVEIGRLLGEHESSVSRHLDRVRRDLRQAVEDILRQGIGAANGSVVQPGLSDAEIALCFEYSAGETPIDLDKLLPPTGSPGPAAGKRTP